MTATETLPPAKPTSSRACPNCTGTLANPPCANCGWEPGLVPVALTQTADGPVTTFAAERRHKFMLAFGVLSCLLGVAIVGSGISGGWLAVSSPESSSARWSSPPESSRSRTPAAARRGGDCRRRKRAWPCPG